MNLLLTSAGIKNASIHDALVDLLRKPISESSALCIPTAIFAFNDNIAIGAIQAAHARGLRVPEELSVVGFDDVEHAAIVTPALTTVRQPLAEMGRTGVSLLMRLLEGKSFETLHVELATRLVVRDSTAPPPRA